MLRSKLCMLLLFWGFQHHQVLISASLDLPAPLAALNSLEGQKRLVEAALQDDFWRLAQHFVTQINSAFCGPASSVMVLNALNTPRPLQTQDQYFNRTDYTYYNQDNIFNAATETVVPKAEVAEEGMSIDQLSNFLAAHPGVSSCWSTSGAPQVTEAVFRQHINTALSQPDMFVIVNFDRDTLLEHGSGHHSPVAAYHQSTDSVLVLDVSRYKYGGAWWVPVPSLYASTAATVDNSTNLTRGLVFVWATVSHPGNACPAAAQAESSQSADDVPSADNGHARVRYVRLGDPAASQSEQQAHAGAFSAAGSYLSASGIAALIISMLAVGMLCGVAVALLTHRTRCMTATRRVFDALAIRLGLLKASSLIVGGRTSSYQSRFTYEHLDNAPIGREDEREAIGMVPLPVSISASRV